MRVVVDTDNAADLERLWQDLKAAKQRKRWEQGGRPDRPRPVRRSDWEVTRRALHACDWTDVGDEVFEEIVAVYGKVADRVALAGLIDDLDGLDLGMAA